jgi:hypothetical protein
VNRANDDLAPHSDEKIGVGEWVSWLDLLLAEDDVSSQQNVRWDDQPHEKISTGEEH